jgi:RNA polymerase sigma-70 factor (ECF subfamily)
MALEPSIRDAMLSAVPSLRSFAISLSGNVDRADDLVQETLLRAVANVDSFQPGTNIAAWLFTILRNLFQERHRKHRLELKENTDISERTSVSTPTGGQELDQFRAALSKLPSAEREALILVGSSGFSYSEAAAICDSSVSTITKRVRRARDRLSKLLNTNSNDFSPYFADFKPPQPKRVKRVMPYDFFLSYSENDQVTAQWIGEVLVGAGFRIFAQFRGIPTGSNFVIEMQKGLAGASRFIALWSAHYAESKHCQAEWSAAYNMDPDGAQRKLIQFLIGPTELPALAKQIVYKVLIGLSPTDASSALLDAIGYRGGPIIIPEGAPDSTAIAQMLAPTGDAYKVAPSADYRLDRVPGNRISANVGGFSPERTFSDLAARITAFTEHVNKPTGNVRYTDTLRQMAKDLCDSTSSGYRSSDELSINRNLVFVLREWLDAASSVPGNNLAHYLAADLYGAYQLLEELYPNLK